MLHTRRGLNGTFRPALLLLALWASVASPALAKDERIPPEAAEIDVQENFTVHFAETNVIETGDVIRGIMGVSSQFRGGQMIVGEVFLETPMLLAKLKAIVRDNSSSALTLNCARAGLFQIEGRDVISGEGCVIVTGDDGSGGEGRASETIEGDN